MPRKTARSGPQTPLGRSGMLGAIHPLASGLPASSENAYHPRQFRVHLGNPGFSDAAASRGRIPEAQGGRAKPQGLRAK